MLNRFATQHEILRSHHAATQARFQKTQCGQWARKEEFVIREQHFKSTLFHEPACFPGPEHDRIGIKRYPAHGQAGQWIPWIVFPQRKQAARTQTSIHHGCRFQTVCRINVVENAVAESQVDAVRANVLCLDECCGTLLPVVPGDFEGRLRRIRSDERFRAQHIEEIRCRRADAAAEIQAVLIREIQKPHAVCQPLDALNGKKFLVFSTDRKPSLELLVIVSGARIEILIVRRT